MGAGEAGPRAWRRGYADFARDRPAAALALRRLPLGASDALASSGAPA